MKLKLVGAFVYLSIVWGSTYLFIKAGLPYWPPLLMAAVRCLLASLACLLILALRKERGEGPVLWWGPVLFGLVNGGAIGLLFWGGQYIPSGQAAVLMGTIPLFAMLFSRWWFHEAMTTGRVLGLVVGLAGVVLAVFERKGAGFSGTPELHLLGQLAVLGTAVGYAAAYALSKPYFRGDLLKNTSIHLGTSGVWLALLSYLLDPRPTWAVLSLPALGTVLYLAVFGSALAYWLKAFLLRHLPSVQATYTALINPVVAVILGVAVFGEHFSALSGLGIGLVLLGAWLVTRPPGQAQVRPAEQPNLSLSGVVK